ncbi:hypothetical protein SPACI_028380 [Sporomusa acidovorans DSM 3132]|uniref:Uncharacterized protein n=1 Tax=Sporomusa acidovorans (strain ATCC 49682 / DSM 3132 / Mol) TaxID=1123286 RepID=A0ABZ3J3G7_SPOA4|nr:hypothetical protein SPACI_26780 [Sporomusa acidovorans DSM 3132]SDD39441.1 hypothetical protein SAMN04488499_1001105 [Sporomusa acidovorans]
MLAKAEVRRQWGSVVNTYPPVLVNFFNTEYIDEKKLLTKLKKFKYIYF